MTPSRHIFFSGCTAAIYLVLAGSANATTVDFNGIPDGTLVSVGNPYGGILNLQATVQVETIDGILSGEGTISTQAPFYPAGDGVVQALPPSILNAGNSSSNVTGTFLQPVTEGNFDVFVYRNAGYSYTGSDGMGGIFNGGGGITGNIESGGTLTWQHFELGLPTGFYLTSFSLSNRDPLPLDAAVWLDNVAFTVVPEPSATVMLGLGGMLLLVFAHRPLRDRPC